MKMTKKRKKISLAAVRSTMIEMTNVTMKKIKIKVEAHLIVIIMPGVRKAWTDRPG